MNKDNYLIKEVPEKFYGKRIDFVIAKLFPDFSRSKLKLWIEEGHVLINEKKISKVSSKFSGGEIIKLFIQESKKEKTSCKKNEDSC